MIHRVHGARLLIVDDDPAMCTLLRSGLEYEGYRVTLAHSRGQLQEVLQRQVFEGILLDLFLGDESTLDAIPGVLAIQPQATVIVMTAKGSIELAVQAMEKGASTFICKSPDTGNIIDEVKQRLQHLQGPRFDATMERESENFGLIGKSPEIRKVLETIHRVKNIDATVLILGESGTGKELVARALHHLSDRAHKPFEAINCGAIPENLLESELFGYRRGAFTDAKADQKGLFEVCDGGTLFLDEIGEMPLGLQVKLLRVLQEREVRPLGSAQAVKVTARVVVATNRDLRHEVNQRNFRADLYYRLSVFTMRIPALRERRDDIPLLVQHYLSHYNERYHRDIEPPSRELMSRIVTYDWPGNIRELQHAIERGVVFSTNRQLNVADIFQTGVEWTSPNSQTYMGSLVYAEAKETFERQYIESVLAATKGNISEAARTSGRFRSDIYRLIKRYEIDLNTFK